MQILYTEGHRSRRRHSRFSPKASPGRARAALVLLALALIVIVFVALGATSSDTTRVTIPAGTRLVAALEDGIPGSNTGSSQEIVLITSDPIELDGGARLPAGLTIHGRATRTEETGKRGAVPTLVLRFDRLIVDGKRYAISAEPFRIRGENPALGNMKEIGGGAFVGGVAAATSGATPITGILGNGVTVPIRRGELQVPAGQRLRIRVTKPVTISFWSGDKA